MYYPSKDKFFNSFFNKLAGNEKLIEDIKANKSVDEIRKQWKEEIEAFKLIRAKYLLYN